MKLWNLIYPNEMGDTKLIQINEDFEWARDYLVLLIYIMGHNLITDQEYCAASLCQSGSVTDTTNKPKNIQLPDRLFCVSIRMLHEPEE